MGVDYRYKQLRANEKNIIIIVQIYLLQAYAQVGLFVYLHVMEGLERNQAAGILYSVAIS